MSRRDRRGRGLRLEGRREGRREGVEGIGVRDFGGGGKEVILGTVVGRRGELKEGGCEGGCIWRE